MFPSLLLFDITGFILSACSSTPLPSFLPSLLSTSTVCTLSYQILISFHPVHSFVLPSLLPTTLFTVNPHRISVALNWPSHLNSSSSSSSFSSSFSFTISPILSFVTSHTLSLSPCDDIPHSQSQVISTLPFFTFLPLLSSSFSTIYTLLLCS